MKHFPTLLLIAALGALPFTSCGGGGARPLAKPNGKIPDGDGKIFRPGGPVIQPPEGSGGGKNREGGKGDMDPNVGAADTGGAGPSSPVPEPGTLLLFGMGLACLALLRRRKRLADLVDQGHGT